MIRQLSRSIREYKMASLATPLLVSGEVVMECLIPFLIAELVNEVKSGCDMNRMRQGLLRAGPQPAQRPVLQHPGLFL